METPNEEKFWWTHLLFTYKVKAASEEEAQQLVEGLTTAVNGDRAELIYTDWDITED